jgi:antitoxin (DNA-binding transcriptional repressor) of toxin-antitoxin stability system
LAAAGETVLISDRDQVVAQLGPPEAGRSGDVADALLANAVGRGLITPTALRNRAGTE